MRFLIERWPSLVPLWRDSLPLKGERDTMFDEIADSLRGQRNLSRTALVLLGTMAQGEPNRTLLMDILTRLERDATAGLSAIEAERARER